MKTGFYPRLAVQGMRKNSKLYLPYILTCIGMVAMFYIVTSLKFQVFLSDMRGSYSLSTALGLGSVVIAVFAAIFLFYTNSFLMRRRKKEFGLFNILGMGKRNLVRILFWEVLIVAVISLVLGIISGILLSKAAELILGNMIGSAITYQITVSLKTIRIATIVFGAIFLLLYLNSLRQIHASNPIALLNSERSGEKPPKANPVIGIIGILLLAGAYWLAVSIDDPLTALFGFFIAVLMVIVGTYMLFVAGSVTMCRLMQKNKKYYYKPSHFVSVSSMAYRMKRNGAGLASICILATMVLVMLASTSCLYFGGREITENRFPRENEISVYVSSIDELTEENSAAVDKELSKVFTEHGVAPETVTQSRYAYINGLFTNDSGLIDLDNAGYNAFGAGDLRQLYFISDEEYNRNCGENVKLKPGEALLYTERCEYAPDTIAIGEIKLQIVDRIDNVVRSGESASLIYPIMYLVIDDLQQLAPLDATSLSESENILRTVIYYGYDLAENDDTVIAVHSDIQNALINIPGISIDGDGEYYYYSGCYAAEKDDFYNSNAGFFFLGIMLSIVFLFATVLIIYYKQLSEGYEDCKRFDIMQKVGMTKKDIRKCVNSQMLTVFLMPMVFAVIHLAFAFPMLHKLLLLFCLNNITLLLITAGISTMIFISFYVLIYRITANAYFSIVSKGDND